MFLSFIAQHLLFDLAAYIFFFFVVIFFYPGSCHILWKKERKEIGRKVPYKEKGELRFRKSHPRGHSKKYFNIMLSIN